MARLGLLLLVLIAVVSCGGPRPSPVLAVVWTDGEIDRYDIVGKTGPLGTAEWKLERRGEGWVYSFDHLVWVGIIWGLREKPAGAP